MGLLGRRKKDRVREADYIPLSAESALGLKQCSGIGCSAHTGIACSYVDRRNRRCPTAWCPAHRKVFADNVYCPLHESTMNGIVSEFGEGIHPDIENRLPALVNWVCRNAEDDIVATMRAVAERRCEVLVSDTVRMVLFSAERIKTWGRTWKSCSSLGVGVQVSISIEERNPEELIVKVNSVVVSRVPTPWELAAGTSRPELDTDVFRKIVMPVSFALDKWEQGLLREVAEGTPTNAAEALDFIAQMMAEEDLEAEEGQPLSAPKVAPEARKEVTPGQLSALEAAFVGADWTESQLPGHVPAASYIGEFELEIEAGSSQPLELAGSRSIRAGRRARTASRRPAASPYRSRRRV